MNTRFLVRVGLAVSLCCVAGSASAQSNDVFILDENGRPVPLPPQDVLNQTNWYNSWWVNNRMNPPSTNFNNGNQNSTIPTQSALEQMRATQQAQAQKLAVLQRQAGMQAAMARFRGQFATSNVNPVMQTMFSQGTMNQFRGAAFPAQTMDRVLIDQQLASQAMFNVTQAQSRAMFNGLNSGPQLVQNNVAAQNLNTGTDTSFNNGINSVNSGVNGTFNGSFNTGLTNNAANFVAQNAAANNAFPVGFNNGINTGFNGVVTPNTGFAGFNTGFNGVNTGTGLNTGLNPGFNGANTGFNGLNPGLNTGLNSGFNNGFNALGGAAALNSGFGGGFGKFGTLRSYGSGQTTATGSRATFR